MKTVFIDRDGTMGGSYYVEYPDEYYPYEGTREAFKILNDNGFRPIVFTNQSCIARGKDKGYDFAAEFKEIGAKDWFICPHDDVDNCNCRKPKTGLLEQAKAKYGLNMEECYVIGDRWSDMASGGKMGCKLILVLTGRGEESLGKDRDKWSEFSPVFVAKDLKEAAEWLCREEHK
ncbi:MAG: HAD-IIIA family hydrolase [Acutalibacteraceae bacterium]|nr:HAD-IIIA family hydrolase [Acutalibacteraceae bacterium]